MIFLSVESAVQRRDVLAGQGVRREPAEGCGGVDGVQALLVLQHMGTYLGDQADPPALVATQVDQDAAALAGDHAERRVELYGRSA
jgi:hypothetical protein